MQQRTRRPEREHYLLLATKPLNKSGIGHKALMPYASSTTRISSAGFHGALLLQTHKERHALSQC